MRHKVSSGCAINGSLYVIVPDRLPFQGWNLSYTSLTDIGKDRTKIECHEPIRWYMYLLEASIIPSGCHASLSSHILINLRELLLLILIKT